MKCLQEAPLRPRDNMTVLTQKALQEDAMGSGVMDRSGPRVAVWMVNDPGLLWPSQILLWLFYISISKPSQSYIQ